MNGIEGRDGSHEPPGNKPQLGKNDESFELLKHTNASWG